MFKYGTSLQCWPTETCKDKYQKNNQCLKSSKKMTARLKWESITSSTLLSGKHKRMTERNESKSSWRANLSSLSRSGCMALLVTYGIDQNESVTAQVITLAQDRSSRSCSPLLRHHQRRVQERAHATQDWHRATQELLHKCGSLRLELAPP